jgi:alpha-ketoglutarate-dependent taurine dioxygenase
MSLYVKGRGGEVAQQMSCVNLSSYEGACARLFDPNERAQPTREGQLPLVISPSDPAVAKRLEDFTAAHSEQIMGDVAAHGAILFRGFEVSSVYHFQQGILSIRGMKGMDDVMMSEAGRTIIDGTRFVLHTNQFFKTGGTLALGDFHNENYYVPDVPRFISFFCLQPSRRGGETGLLNTAGLYRALPDGLKRELEAEACQVATIPFADVLARYQLTGEQLENFCRTAGLRVIERDNTRFIVIYKPSVFVHPVTNEKALSINFSGVLGSVGLRAAMVDSFLPDYAGSRWMLHRLVWRWPFLVEGPKHLRFLLSNPKAIWHGTSQAVRAFVQGERVASSKNVRPRHRIAALIRDESVGTFAASVRQNFSAFPWQKGDVLLIDNIKTAHAGMAGAGKREIRALMCNRLSVPCSPDGPGILSLSPQEETRTLGSRLTSLQRGQRD